MENMSKVAEFEKPSIDVSIPKGLNDDVNQIMKINSKFGEPCIEHVEEPCLCEQVKEINSVIEDQTPYIEDLSLIIEDVNENQSTIELGASKSELIEPCINDFNPTVHGEVEFSSIEDEHMLGDSCSITQVSHADFIVLDMTYDEREPNDFYDEIISHVEYVVSDHDVFLHTSIHSVDSRTNLLQERENDRNPVTGLVKWASIQASFSLVKYNWTLHEFDEVGMIEDCNGPFIIYATRQEWALNKDIDFGIYQDSMLVAAYERSYPKWAFIEALAFGLYMAASNQVKWTSYGPIQVYWALRSMPRGLEDFGYLMHCSSMQGAAIQKCSIN